VYIWIKGDLQKYLNSKNRGGGKRPFPVFLGAGGGGGPPIGGGIIFEKRGFYFALFFSGKKIIEFWISQKKVQPGKGETIYFFIPGLFLISPFFFPPFPVFWGGGRTFFPAGAFGGNFPLFFPKGAKNFWPLLGGPKKKCKKKLPVFFFFFPIVFGNLGKELSCFFALFNRQAGGKKPPPRGGFRPQKCLFLAPFSGGGMGGLKKMGNELGGPLQFDTFPRHSRECGGDFNPKNAIFFFPWGFAQKNPTGIFCFFFFFLFFFNLFVFVACFFFFFFRPFIIWFLNSAFRAPSPIFLFFLGDFGAAGRKFAGGAFPLITRFFFPKPSGGGGKNGGFFFFFVKKKNPPNGKKRGGTYLNGGIFLFLGGGGGQRGHFFYFWDKAFYETKTVFFLNKIAEKLNKLMLENPPRVFFLRGNIGLWKKKKTPVNFLFGGLKLAFGLGGGISFSFARFFNKKKTNWGPWGPRETKFKFCTWKILCFFSKHKKPKKKKTPMWGPRDLGGRGRAQWGKQLGFKSAFFNFRGVLGETGPGGILGFFCFWGKNILGGPTFGPQKQKGGIFFLKKKKKKNRGVVCFFKGTAKVDYFPGGGQGDKKK